MSVSNQSSFDELSSINTDENEDMSALDMIEENTPTSHCSDRHIPRAKQICKFAREYQKQYLNQILDVDTSLYPDSTPVPDGLYEKLKLEAKLKPKKTRQRAIKTYALSEVDKALILPPIKDHVVSDKTYIQSTVNRRRNERLNNKNPKSPVFVPNMANTIPICQNYDDIGQQYWKEKIKTYSSPSTRGHSSGGRLNQKAISTVSDAELEKESQDHYPTRINKVIDFQHVLCKRKHERETPYEKYLKTLPSPSPSPSEKKKDKKELKKYKSLTTNKVPLIKPSNYLDTLMKQLNELMTEENDNSDASTNINKFMKLSVSDLCKKRAAASIFSILKKHFHYVKKRRFNKMKEFLEYDRFMDYHRAATQIQRIYRGYYDRFKLEEKSKECGERNIMSKEDKLSLQYETHLKAVLIQSVWRMYKCKEYYKILKFHNSCVLKIQKLWGKYYDKIKDNRAKQLYMLQCKSAIIIEKIFRRFRDKQKVKKMISEMTHEKLSQILSNPKTKNQYLFKQFGATLRIVRWCKNYLKYKHIKFIGHVKAIKIQKLYRLHRRKEHIKWFNKMKNDPQFQIECATKIAKIWKGYKVRNFIKSDSEEVRKYKEFTPYPKLCKYNIPKIRKFYFSLITLQCFVRTSNAKRELKGYKKIKENNLRRVRQMKFVVVIQKWIRCRLNRKKYIRNRNNKAAKKIQRKFKSRRMKFHVEHFSSILKLAIYCQKIIRGFLSRRRYKEIMDRFNLILKTTIYLQSIFRMWICKIQKFQLIDVKRIEHEDIICVTPILRHCYRYIRHREILRSANSNLDTDSVFQSIYRHFCGRFTRNTTMILENPQYITFIREAPKLLDRNFTLHDADLIYNRMKDNEVSHMVYNQFIKALYAISNKKFPKTEKYYDTKGQDGRLIRLCEQYLCNDNIHWSRQCKDQLESQVHIYVDEAVFTLQRFCGYILANQRRIHKKVVERQNAQKEYRERCAAKIQSTFRSHQVRKQLQQLALKRYEKYYDCENGLYFYKDKNSKKTDTMMKKKPLILYKADIKKVTKIYNPNDDFTVICKYCKKNLSTTLCCDCKLTSCEICNKTSHRNNEIMKFHIHVPIKYCIKCENTLFNRVATVCCTECNDLLCDICFHEWHKHGKMSKHTYTELVDHCQLCNERPSRWNCEDCNQNICYRCYKTTHTNRIMLKHKLTPIPFINIECKKYLLEQERIKKEEEEEELNRFNQTIKEEPEIKELTGTEKNLSKLQAKWRGMRIRKLKLLEREKKSVHKYLRCRRRSVLQYKDGTFDLDTVDLPSPPKNENAELLKSLRATQPAPNPLEDPYFVPGKGEIKKGEKVIKTTDDVRKYLKRGDPFKFVANSDGECKEFTYEVSVDPKDEYTCDTIPLNRQYSGDDKNDITLTKIDKVKTTEKIGETFNTLGKAFGKIIGTTDVEEENVEDLNAEPPGPPSAPPPPSKPALPYGWSEEKDQEGNVYYYNKTTGESQWDRPTLECLLRNSKSFLSNSSSNYYSIYQFYTPSKENLDSNRDSKPALSNTASSRSNVNVVSTFKKKSKKDDSIKNVNPTSSIKFG